MPDCTVLIKQEVVATLYQLAYLTLSFVCLSQQSQWVKHPNDSPGRPLVPMAASTAGRGPVGKKIGKKKRCRSAQTRHLFKKNCHIQVWSSFTISLVAATGFEQRADTREPVRGGWGPAKVTVSTKQRVVQEVLTIISNVENTMTSLKVLYAQAWFTKTATPLWINLNNKAAGVYSKSIKPVEHCRWLH